MSGRRIAIPSCQRENCHSRQQDKAAAADGRISERFLIQVWQRLPVRTGLISEQGEIIQLIYPGMENDDQGADLKDAVISLDQELVKGDIEFHRWSSDWKKHHHHQNPAYNSTILHVVMWRDTESVTYLQSGRRVPILVLSRYLETTARKCIRTGYATDFSALPCYQAARALPIEKIAEMLDAAGRERFLAKAAAFQDGLSRDTPEQTLYRGIMGALGYSKNKLPFEELADRVPLHRLEAAFKRPLTDDQCLAQQQALLLGTAGLLPSQQGIGHAVVTSAHWVETLERYWSEYDHSHKMSTDSWCLVKVRPNNSPVRRIAGISYLLLRYRKEGILEEITNLISEIRIDQAYLALVAGLTVMASDYWKTHYDFGCYSRHIAPALIGGSRAAAIAVNIVLPFTYAWSRLKAKPELVAKTLAIFSTSPKPGTNAIERHMSKQLVRSGVPINSAQRQQGLIHIYKTLCTQGKCAVCPLGAAAKGQGQQQTYVVSPDAPIAA